MNNVKYVNRATGERKTVRVGQGGRDWLDQTDNRIKRKHKLGDIGSLPMSATRRRPTVAEADRAMKKMGFERA